MSVYAQSVPLYSASFIDMDFCLSKQAQFHLHQELIWSLFLLKNFFFFGTVQVIAFRLMITFNGSLYINKRRALYLFLI